MRSSLLGSALLGVGIALAGSGCHREYVIHDPLTADEVIRLSQQGLPPEEIIHRIDQSGTVYLLDAQDILQLGERGVEPDVIEHMRRTRERELERRYWGYYYPAVPVYYHYWWPYGFGWHFGWHSYWW